MNKWFNKKRLFQLHGWLGINLSILLFVICLSGALATISNELDWLFNPDIRVTPQEKTVSWGTIYDQVQSAYPDAHVAWMSRPLGPRYAADVVILTEDQLLRHVYVNPYSGEVQGSTSYFNIQRFFRSFHFHLFMPNPFGSLLVSFFGLVLLTTLITGMIVYKSWYKRLFKLTLGKGKRAFYGSLHKLVGAWSIPFMAIIAVTGIWYFLEDLGIDKTFKALPKPQISEEALATYGSMPQVADLDVMLTNAKEAYPELTVTSIWFPRRSNQPVEVRGQAEAIMVRDRANKVFVNPFDAQVMGVQKGVELDVANRIVDTADPLHFGTWGGLATKLLYFVFGMSFPILIFTGAWLFLKRAKKLSTAKQRKKSSGKLITSKV